MTSTLTLVPLATYPAQPGVQTFTAQLPAGTTALDVTIHAPLQAAFDYSLEFYDGPTGAGPWRDEGSAACQCRATDSLFHLDRPQAWVRADLTLNTSIQASVTLTLYP